MVVNWETLLQCFLGWVFEPIRTKERFDFSAALDEAVVPAMQAVETVRAKAVAECAELARAQAALDWCLQKDPAFNGAPLEDGSFVYWSSYYWDDGAQTAGTARRLFTTPLGQYGQGKSTYLNAADTNVKDGRLAHAFTAKAMLIELWGAPVDRDLFRQTCTLWLNTMQRMDELCAIGSVFEWRREEHCDVGRWAVLPPRLSSFAAGDYLCIVAQLDGQINSDTLDGQINSDTLSGPFVMRITLVGAREASGVSMLQMVLRQFSEEGIGPHATEIVRAALEGRDS